MKKCIVCGAELIKEPLILCKNMPASAQDIPTKDELPKDKGIDLNLCQCSGCGLVQFDCEPVSYYRDVIRAGGYSTTMVELRRTQYKHFIEKCNLKNKKIIEVGCGQGEFLQVLTEFPVKAYGIEHKLSLVEKAREKGLCVENEFTENAECALSNGPFDAFLSFNFLEHQPDPNTMMRCIYNNLSDNGFGLVTVPSFEYILEHNSFYELLRDHIANYTEDTLRFLMEKNGFKVLECTIINRDTLSVIVQKRPRVNIKGLSDNFELLKTQMNNFVKERTADNKKIAIWGASHQGFTAASTTGISADISYIIDSAPFKQGKYSPASHIPIVSPDHFFAEPVDSIIVIAPGYTEEIVNTIRTRFSKSVEVAVLKSATIEKPE